MISIISGTNRSGSISLLIAKQYQEILINKNIESEIIDLQHLPGDFTTTALYKKSGTSEGYNLLQSQIDRADKFVFIVPEYNGSFPGVLKAFIDGLRYPDSFNNKKSALVGVSSGIQGGIIAISHMTDVLNYMGMHVLALKLKFAQIEKNMQNQKVINPLYLDLMEQQAEQLLKF